MGSIVQTDHCNMESDPFPLGIYAPINDRTDERLDRIQLKLSLSINAICITGQGLSLQETNRRQIH